MEGYVKFKRNASIISHHSVVGRNEHDGPLGEFFDDFSLNDTFEKDSWEKAESEMQRRALEGALSKKKISKESVDLLVAGDLLNQCVGSTYGLIDFGIPYVGIYGACSTCALGLALSACFYDGGIINTGASVTSSHFCSSERQFRFPLEYGGQRAPTSQWTVTGAGAYIIGNGEGVKIKSALFGKTTDMGISDINNMGAAMAPAARNTLLDFLSNDGHSVDYFDLIVTGDLGYEGSEILKDLLMRDGVDIYDRHTDCGLLIFDRERQDKHAGGSGCGCSASVLSAKILRDMENGVLNNILFIGTGALMNPLTLYQGNSIPSIAHLVHLSTE